MTGENRKYGAHMQRTRRYKRFPVEHMGIKGNMAFARKVKIHDISIGGISLKTDRELNIGDEYTFRIQWNDHAMTVHGVVVWSSLDETAKAGNSDTLDPYRNGMQFSSVSRGQFNEIVRFIEEHKRETDKDIDIYSLSGERLHMRFLIEPPDKVILSLRENYKVKKLSPGGMLIENDRPLDIENRLPMEIFFPEKISVKVAGRVASCLSFREKNSEHYDIGIEFMEISRNDSNVLNDFIHTINNAS